MEKKLVCDRIAIVSRYFLPNTSVDSVSVYNMSRSLLSLTQDVEIHIVTTVGTYKSKTDFQDIDNNIFEKLNIHKVTPIATSKNIILNFFFGIIDGIRLAHKVSRLNADKIIYLTNPPLITMFFHLFFKLQKLYYWSFDIYPDAFVADGLMTSENIFYRFLNFLTYKKHPANIVALGESQFEYLTQKFGTNRINKIILPCGIHQNLELAKIPDWHTNEKIILGYIGNIGRAHHVDFVLNIMNAISQDEKFQLVLSIYGHHSEKILDYAAKLKSNNIKIIDPLLQNQLKYIDIHLVSLNETWTNISVPSKAVSAICSGRPLWFCGSPFSDTYQMFKNCCFYSDSTLESIKVVLNALNKTEINIRSKKAQEEAHRLVKVEIEAYQKILK